MNRVPWLRVWWFGLGWILLLGLSGCNRAAQPAAATATTEAQLATLVAEVYRALTATAQPPAATATPFANADQGTTAADHAPARAATATAVVTGQPSAPASPTRVVPATAPPPSATAFVTASPTWPPTATPAWPTATPQPPTATSAWPTATPQPPTATPAWPTATPQPPTATPAWPTATPQPPTATSVPPTATPQPPTATPVPPTATPAGCTPSANAGYESQVVALINQERQAQGLPALQVHASLQAAARAHSADMICNDFFSHTGSDGSQPWDRATRYGYSWTWIGENLFMGTGISPSTVVQGWMNSSGHRANILASEAVHIGVGYLYDAAEGAWYVTALFGRP